MRTLLLTLVLMSSSAAFATNYGCTFNYLSEIHFGKSLNGKAISSVYAHVGALEERPLYLGGGTYWTDVKHIPLEDKGDHFFATVEVKGWSGYSVDQNKGAIVQYWIYFEDGTETKTDVFSIELRQSTNIGTWNEYRDMLELERDRQSQTKDGDRTIADMIGYCSVS
ncbi:MAG: hypothetical protein R3B45_01270 [Bdellovibrionota bacterium]